MTLTNQIAAPSVQTAAEIDRLCRENIALVHHEVTSAAQRLPRHVCRDDLVSAGMAALAGAARSFDAELGVPFARFAALRIRGGIIDALRSADWASRSVRTKARRRDVAYDALCARLRRTPAPEELAAELGVEVSELEAMEGDVQRAVVLSVNALEDEGVAESVLPTCSLTPEAVLLEREKMAYLHDAVESLPERLRVVVQGYFLEDRAMKEIAEELGVTESRVSQLRAEAVQLLRAGLVATLEPERVVAEETSAVVARRRAAYFATVASRSDFRARVSVPAARAPFEAEARTAQSA